MWSFSGQLEGSMYIRTPLLCLKKTPGTLGVLFCDWQN